MLNFRELLDDLNIEWRDRGKNCSRNNINIACCFCEDDPSFHLSISEHKVAYYCYRNPDQHSGQSLNRLLVALGLDYEDIPAIINKYDSDVVITPLPKKSVSNVQAAWDRFLPAADSNSCASYLRTRGFPTPISTARQYDLRFSAAGRWAQRLLLPIRTEGQVVSWTGRSLLKSLQPRYLMADTDADKLLYVPRSIRSTLIIVEGPLDALKVAVATDNRSISSIALLGKGYFGKLDKIAELAQDCNHIYLTLDADVSTAVLYDCIYELSARVTCPVGRLPLPYGEADPGGMALDAIQEWVKD